MIVRVGIQPIPIFFFIMIILYTIVLIETNIVDCSVLVYLTLDWFYSSTSL